MAVKDFGNAIGQYPFYYFVALESGGRFYGLRIVDLSDPNRPTVRGELALPEINSVAVEGALACVTVRQQSTSQQGIMPSQPGGLRLVDVSDPGRPRILAALNLRGAQTVAVSGGRAFVGVGERGPNEPTGVHVLDIADPRRPRLLGFCPLESTPTKLQPFGNGVLAALSYGGLRVIDASDPKAPRVIGRSRVHAEEIAVRGTQVYLSAPYLGVTLLDLTHPSNPTRVGQPPSADTLGYLKRRVRRVLRALAKRDPERYVSLAYEVLAAGNQNLNLHDQWVTTDILFGGTNRYAQTRHGRGGYRQIGFGFHRRTRDERAPDAWDRRPDLATALLQNDKLPWQTHETALKIVNANRGTVPTLSARTLERFFEAPSPLLRGLAARQVAARLAQGQGVDAPLAASAFFWAAGRARRAMALPVADGFAARLLTLATSTLAEGRLPRRARGALGLIAEQFAASVTADAVLPLVGTLRVTADPALTALAVAGARRVQAQDALEWLFALADAPDGPRATVLAALEVGIRGQELVNPWAFISSESAFVRDAGWRLIAAGATPPAVLGTLWNSLLDELQETPALRTAMASPAALGLLERAGIGADVLAQKLRDRPFLVNLLSPQTFATITATTPANVTLSLIAAAPDELWARLRPGWLRGLQEGVGLEAFWQAAPRALAQDDEGHLESRLLEDADVAETFLTLHSPDVLDIREPAFGPLLGRWARAHAALFTRDSATLLQAATHPLPDVRDWALARVQDLGVMGLPFALRLLESALPPSMAVGQTFFDAVPPGGARELDYALALCDSPQTPVRALGRQYVTARWDSLPHDRLLRALFENPDPSVQAFVADLLQWEASLPGETAAFAGEVLRARQRGRTAKERVKARQAAAPTVDVETLLALARSRTPRDAEWALGQLAKLALAGQVIEGLSVDGVAGV